MAMKLALVSAQGVDVQAIDDRWLLATAIDRGVDAQVVRWDDPTVDWLAFDAVWLRSCWDYHKRYDEFTAWLRRADAAGTRFVNDVPLVLRNSHKRYLLDLQQAGVRVAPLRLVTPGDYYRRDDGNAGRSERFNALRALSDTDWPDIVIKPAVSASAYLTWRASDVPLHESAARVESMLADGRDVILQRFVPEIGTRGEWSIVFFDGVFSHAVRRVPPSGEFRSQLEFGATLTVAMPAAPLLATAHDALRSISRGQTPCVARLDLVETDDGPVLMEVELIEPVLYFGEVPSAAARALDIIERRALTPAS